MARRKELRKYSQEYLHLFEVANEKTVTIACDSKHQAENLRNELYTCRSVIYDEGSDGLARAAQNVRFFIRLAESGWHLLAEPIRKQSTKEKENGTEKEP